MFEKKALRNTQPMDLKKWGNITTDINVYRGKFEFYSKIVEVIQRKYKSSAVRRMCQTPRKLEIRAGCGTNRKMGNECSMWQTSKNGKCIGSFRGTDHLFVCMCVCMCVCVCVCMRACVCDNNGKNNNRGTV